MRFFGRIRKRICDLRSFGSCRIEGTDESTLDKDSSVPLMRPDPNDLRSQIRFRILPKKTHPIISEGLSRYLVEKGGGGGGGSSHTLTVGDWNCSPQSICFAHNPWNVIKFIPIVSVHNFANQTNFLKVKPVTIEVNKSMVHVAVFFLKMLTVTITQVTLELYDRPHITSKHIVLQDVSIHCSFKRKPFQFWRQRRKSSWSWENNN